MRPQPREAGLARQTLCGQVCGCPSRAGRSRQHIDTTLMNDAPRYPVSIFSVTVSPLSLAPTGRSQVQLSDGKTLLGDKELGAFHPHFCCPGARAPWWQPRFSLCTLLAKRAGCREAILSCFPAEPASVGPHCFSFSGFSWVP